MFCVRYSKAAGHLVEAPARTCTLRRREAPCTLRDDDSVTRVVRSCVAMAEVFIVAR